MKRFPWVLISLLFLISLTACSDDQEIIGIWEQEMETAILGEGIEEATSIVSLRRFTFRENGTGIQEHIIADGSYPDAVREFTWKLEEDTLTLEYEENNTDVFAVMMSKTTLKLENPRGSYALTKAE